MITQNPEILTSPTAIAAYARDNGLINLADNYSAVEIDAGLQELLNKYIHTNSNEASPQFGLLDLRSAISKKSAKRYDYTYDATNEVTITTGVRQGIFATIISLLKEGDEVLLFEPTHQSYNAAIEIAGGTPVYVSLKAPNFHVEWEEVQRLITNKTRMVIVNSPNFPTGSTFSELDMIRLQKILQGTKIVVLSDESFEHVVFDGEMHQSIALYPFLRERGVIVSSFSETLHIRNWRVGYCMAPAHLMKEIRKVIAIMGEGINLPYQMAIAEFMKEYNDFKSLALFYQKKRDIFLNIIEDSKFKAIPSKGTYFQLISMEQQNDKSDMDVVHKLISELGIATVPIRYYYHENSKKKYLRLNLSVPDDVIVEVATRLKNF